MRLRDDLSKLRRGFRAWMIGITAALVQIASGVGWNQWSQHLQRIEQERQAALAAETKRLLEIEALQAKLQHELTQAQIAAAAKKAEEEAQKAAADLAAIKAKQAEQEKITAAKVRAQLIESSEAARDAELAVADKEPAYDKLEEMREAAKAAHTARLSRIDNLADEYARIEQRSGTTEEFREMVRILTEEKVNTVEKALAYAEKHRAERFERVRARKLAEQQQSRADLQIDLKAASTEAASGQPAAASKLFEELLTLEPNWAEALNPYCWFLFDQSIQANQHGTLKSALVDAQRCLELAERLAGLAPLPAGSERTLSAACNQMGDILVKRGQPGDAEQALRYYQRDLEISERLLKQNPDSAAFARDVMVSHYKLGEVSVSQSQYAAAIPHFQNGIVVLDRMLEKRLNVEVTEREKTTLESRVQFCEVAQLATGDWETLLKIDANVLPQLLSFRATLMAKQGRVAEVAQAGDKLREREPKTSGDLYNAACAYALCVGLVMKDKPPPSETELAQQQKYISQSLASLKEAIAAGFNDFEHLRQDPDLTPLHGLPEFEALFPKGESK